MPDYKDNFHLINDGDDIIKVFNQKFDIIISNQTLYFLDDKTLKKRLKEFFFLLNRGGYVLFTMMSREHYFSKYSIGVSNNGLEKISFSKNHRFSGKTPEVRFIESLDHMKILFGAFKPLKLGFYDVSLCKEESANHYIFIGKKN